MLNRFDSYVADGLISRKVSPCGRLVLFDYTEKCQWEKAWDDVTMNARGTVYELATGNVVARSFPKFFNFGELTSERQSELMSQSFSVAEKMDGSLGIIYFYDGKWHVNTRGSFISEQAIKGLELLQPYKEHLDKKHTYLVEIIYPENRIVVDYKGESKLVLLSEFHTKSGEETNKDYQTLEFPHIAEEYSFDDLGQLQAKLGQLSFNEEGYVVKFEDGTRAKFKGDEYVKMHRIISGMSPLVLWESMKMGCVDEALLASIPEEFRDVYEKMAETLELNHYMIYVQATDYALRVLQELGLPDEVTPEGRKALGLYAKENENEFNQYLFPVYLGKDDQLYEMIRKAIKPKGNVL